MFENEGLNNNLFKIFLAKTLKEMEKDFTKYYSDEIKVLTKLLNLEDQEIYTSLMQGALIESDNIFSIWEKSYGIKDFARIDDLDEATIFIKKEAQDFLNITAKEYDSGFKSSARYSLRDYFVQQGRILAINIIVYKDDVLEKGNVFFN